MVDCGDVAVFLKTSDSRLQCNLSFGEFFIVFGIHRDILCHIFSDRREEFNLYLAMLADFSQRYGGTLFYEYHKSFAEKPGSFITQHNTRLDWSITDSEHLVRNFGGQRTLVCQLCSSHGHSAAFCPKTLHWVSPNVHDAVPVYTQLDVKGRPIIEFNGIPLCNNFNESVITPNVNSRVSAAFTRTCTQNLSAHDDSDPHHEESGMLRKNSEWSPLYSHQHKNSLLLPFLLPRFVLRISLNYWAFSRVSGRGSFPTVYLLCSKKLAIHSSWSWHSFQSPS